MQEISNDEYRRRMSTFLETHSSYYTEAELRYLKKLMERRSDANIYRDKLRQIYDELGLIPDSANIYQGFLNLIIEKYGIERNIIEVGGGIVPSLSKKIALRQKTGKITVYDPRLMPITTTNERFVLKEEYFSKSTSIGDADLIIGFMPCEATIDIIDSALENRVDFMIALCEGGSRIGFEWLENDEEWISFVVNYANVKSRAHNFGTVENAFLHEYKDPYPVIYSKRFKQ